MHQFLWQYYTAYETPCFCQALRTIFETRVICAKHTHTNACVCMCGRLHGVVKITVNSSNRNVSLILLLGVSITVAAASVWCVCVFVFAHQSDNFHYKLCKVSSFCLGNILFASWLVHCVCCCVSMLTPLYASKHVNQSLDCPHRSFFVARPGTIQAKFVTK